LAELGDVELLVAVRSREPSFVTITSKSEVKPLNTPATCWTVRSMIASSLYAGSTAEILNAEGILEF